jgi:hypothetical protein
MDEKKNVLHISQVGGHEALTLVLRKYGSSMVLIADQVSTDTLFHMLQVEYIEYRYHKSQVINVT